MTFPVQKIREIVRSKRMTAFRSLPLTVVLSLCLLFSQLVENVHSHEGDLRAQFDCETCLKLGSSDDTALAGTSSLSFPAAHQIFSILIQNQTSSELIKATSRGPPSYT